MNTKPTENQPDAVVKISLPARRRFLPNLAGILFALLVVFVLAGLIMPSFGGVQVKGMQTKSLAQAKQIGLALKIFAGDHEGKYPGQGVPVEMVKAPRLFDGARPFVPGGLGVPVEMTRAPANSNAAFACLFPTYATSETIFGNKLSAYQTHPPDNIIDNPATFPPVKTLEPGENVYAYVAGLTDASSPDAPIVLDGTDGTSLYYNSTPAVRGGVWEGKKAVVIYLDNHGGVETLTGSGNTRYIPVHLPGRPNNLLDFSWLGSGVHLLDPAVAP